MINLRWRKWLVGVAVIISFIMHYKHFSKDLMSIHVWRQTQTQSTINSFYEEDFNILNPRRNDRGDTVGFFRMEFPLMQWMVAASYHLFGKSIMVTRILMFLIGVISMLGLYYLVKTLFKQEFPALIASWTLAFSPCFYYYTINPIPDNLALATAIWAMAFFFKWIDQKKIRYAIASSIFLAVATLCKLPFVLYYGLALVYFLLKLRNKKYKGFLWEGIIFGIPFLAPFIWYAWVIPSWGGNMILKGVTDNQVPWSALIYYATHTFSSTLPELLINYGAVLFFVIGTVSFFKHKKYKDGRSLYLITLLLLLLGYYFYEINAIADVHDYYLFPFYPLISIVLSYGAVQLYQHSNMAKMLTGTLLVLIPFFCYLRMQVRWNPEAPGFNKDLLSYQISLQAAVPSDALVVAGNDVSHFIFLYYIDKKGWGFDNDNLKSSDLKAAINKGADYLYLDSDKIQQDTSIMSMTDTLICRKGSICVYRLKKD